MQLTFGENLILASHNEGKLLEFQRAFEPVNISVISASERQLPEPEETADSFLGNAILKAKAAAVATQLPALADDSGLAVEGLGGAPGIYSARWAGPEKDFGIAFERIKSELSAKDLSPTGARAAFVCVLALVWPTGQMETAEGRVEGHLTFPPRGDAGFGYDPIFVPDGDDRTFAEMTHDEKGTYSHRMRAWSDLKPRIFPTS